MPRKPYRWLEHTADIRVRVFGGSLREIFSHAAWALTDAITDLKKIRPARVLKLRLRAADRESLLVTLLKELLFLFDTRKFLARRLAIDRLDEGEWVGRAIGEKFDPARHRLKTEIKAVTYHGLYIRRGRGGWQAEVIFDV